MDKWEEAAHCLRVLSHKHRLRMIDLLLKNGELSVGELAAACGILPNVASEHLTLMKNNGFVHSRKVEKNVIYSIEEEALASIMQCIHKRFKEDKEK